MAKLLYSATMSLDGFIAGADGDMSWLTEHLGPNEEVGKLIGEIGALLIGRRTFGGDDPHRGDEGEGKPFGGGWSGPQFILTHRPPPADDAPDLIFVDDLEDAVARAKAAAGDKYVNVQWGALLSRPVAGERGLDQSPQLAGLERLADVLVGAEREAMFDIGLLGAGGQQEDRDFVDLGIAADRFDDFIAGHRRHRHIEHGQGG